VIDYFFQHYREADFAIRFADASVEFRGDLEGQVRDRSLVQFKSTLSRFERFAENPFLHEVSTSDITDFLKSLRARGGINQAKAKTWNNYRADLHLFFGWCAAKQRRWVAANPVTDVPSKQVENGNVEILPLDRTQQGN
jgi:site-specific recombinase XerD